MQRSRVVLPQPLGPTMQRISLSRTARLSARNATAAPSRNVLLTLRATIASAPTSAAIRAGPVQSVIQGASKGALQRTALSTFRAAGALLDPTSRSRFRAATDINEPPTGDVDIWKMS